MQKHVKDILQIAEEATGADGDPLFAHVGEEPFSSMPETAFLVDGRPMDLSEMTSDGGWYDADTTLECVLFVREYDYKDLEATPYDGLEQLMRQFLRAIQGTRFRASGTYNPRRGKVGDYDVLVTPLPLFISGTFKIDEDAPNHGGS